MSSLPDCCYEYRYEAPQAKIVENCTNCNGDICEGDNYYDINGLILCDECLSNYRKEG